MAAFHPDALTTQAATLASSDGEEDSMYSTYGGQKRGLLRPYAATASGPIFRNLPLFGFLAGLVLFFFIFYIYQAQSAELNLMRDQSEFERTQHAKIKTENIDLKAQLEKYRGTELDLKKELREAQISREECSANLKKEADKVQSYKLNSEKLQKEKSDCSNSLATLKAQMAQLNQTVDDLRANITARENLMKEKEKYIGSLQAQVQGGAAQSSAVMPKQRVNLSGRDIVAESRVTSIFALHEKIPLEELHGQKKAVSEHAITKENVAGKIEGSILLDQSRGSFSENGPDRNGEASILHISPQLNKQSNGSTSDGNSEAPNLREPPNLGDVLSLNKAKEAAQVNSMNKEQEIKQYDVKGGGDAEGKLVVGGEYNDDVAGAEEQQHGEAAPDFENDEKRLKIPDV